MTENATDGAIADGAPPDRPTVSSLPLPRLQIVASGLYPPDFGGADLRVHKTLLRLRSIHHLPVDVLAFAGALTRPGGDLVDGIPVRRLPMKLDGLPLARAVYRQLRETKRAGATVVHIISSGRTAYIAALSAKILGFKLIVEIVNCTLHDTVSRRSIARLFLRSADLVVAISEPVARDVRALGVGEDRLWVRPNPVDISRHRLPELPERQQQRARLGIDADTVLHLVAGSIAQRKNQLFAIDVIEALAPHHSLLLIGPVLPQNAPYAQRLRERIAASPACDRIKLVDRFTDEMHRVMYAADCLWMPSLEEGLGNVMLEALCCGVPCVINETLGLDEHIQDGVNGRQAPLDPGAWAAAVTSLLPTIRDPDHRRAISEAACQRYDAAAFDQEFYRRLTALARREPKACFAEDRDP